MMNDLVLQADPTAQLSIHPAWARARGQVIVGPGCRLVLGSPIHLTERTALTITVANGAEVVIGDGCYLEALYISADGPGGVELGRGTTVNGAGLVAHEGRWIRFGADCMLATEIAAHTSDHHTIWDVRTGERINSAEDIEIGEHVWIGTGVTVLKGSRIGSGSVIGARSLVNGPIEESCIAAGTPARVVRKGVRWER